MKIAICDDNTTYVDELQRLVKSFLCNKTIEFDIDTFYNSDELYNCNDIYDIAFLDIEMQPYSGIEIAKQMKKNNPHIIIFIITSYNRYLDEAMDLNVFRYIQKPLDIRRLKDGMEKAIEFIDNNIISFYLKKGNATKNLSSNDIIYIETVGRSTKIVTIDNTYLSDNKIDFWKSKLIASFFYRIHKSFIVNMNYITHYERDTLILFNQHKVPVSYRKQAEFRKAFLSYIGGR